MRRGFVHLSFVSAMVFFMCWPGPTSSQSVITTKISSCGEIVSNGNYVLDLNIGSSGNCLNVHDASSVFIDCNNHSISGLGDILSVVVQFQNVNNFSLTSCTINTGSSTDDIGSTPIPLLIKNSANGVISRSMIGKYNIEVIDSSGIKFKNNTSESSYGQSYTSGSEIEDNFFALNVAGYPTGYYYTPAVVSSAFGSNTRIVHNSLNGGARGIFSETIGADDGIFITDEHDDIIRDNTIKNIWDCGIETSGLIENTAIGRNIIDNAGLCGIGGWYWSSWKNNKISENTAINTPRLFWNFRIFGLRPQGWDWEHKFPADAYVYFSGNTFDGNRLLNQKGFDFSAVIDYKNFSSRFSNVPGEKLVTLADLILGNNVFSGNDFNVAANAPLFLPELGMIVDGGGNICSKVGSFNNLLTCSSQAITYAVRDTTKGFTADQSNFTSPPVFSLGDKFILRVTTVNPYVGPGKVVYLCVDARPSTATDVNLGCFMAGTTDSMGSLELANDGWPFINTQWLGTWEEHSEIHDGNNIFISPHIRFTLNAK